YFGKRRLPLIGLFLALAVASRPAAILAFVAFGVAILTAPGASRKVTDLARKAVELGAGVVLPALVVVVYNVLRFGSIFDKSAHLHYIQDSYRLQVAPGEFAVAHVPF